jgi:hypothetical protein
MSERNYDDGTRFVECWACQGEGRELRGLLDIAALRAPATSWNNPDQNPSVQTGDMKEFVVAVFRKHTEKIYTFAACYLNAYELEDRHEGTTKLFTGWYSQTGDEDYASLFEPLALNEGDKLMGWRELPKWDCATATSAPANGHRLSEQAVAAMIEPLVWRQSIGGEGGISDAIADWRGEDSLVESNKIVEELCLKIARKMLAVITPTSAPAGDVGELSEGEQHRIKWLKVAQVGSPAITAELLAIIDRLNSRPAAQTTLIENADHWQRPWRAERHHGMNRSSIVDADGFKIIGGMNNEKAELIAAFANAYPLPATALTGENK